MSTPPASLAAHLVPLARLGRGTVVIYGAGCDPLNRQSALHVRLHQQPDNARFDGGRARGYARDIHQREARIAEHHQFSDKRGGHIVGAGVSHLALELALVPPQAPFLKGSDIVLAADCVGFAHGDFHRKFLKGRSLLVACPKLDDFPAHLQKLAEILKQAKPESLTVLEMEVPCCQGLPVIVEKGMEKAGKKIPVEKVIISARGDVLNRERLAA